MDILSFVANRITLLDIGKNVHSWVTGYSLARKVDQIHNCVEQIYGRIWEFKEELTRIGNFVFHHPVSEIRGGNNAGSIIYDKKQIILPQVSVLKATGASQIIISDITELPPEFVREFQIDPELFLFYSFELRGGGLPPTNILQDKTLVPMKYSRESKSFVGFIKKGYLKNYLGVDYEAFSRRANNEDPFRNPYTQQPISRNNPCFCKSGLRYNTVTADCFQMLN